MVAIIQPLEKKEEIRRYTLEEYFKLEEKADYKSEFHNGKIIPMAGGSINHNKLSVNICGLLFMNLFNSEKEISVHNSDQKIYIVDYKRIVYTDTFLVIGAEETYQNSKQVITNPTLIVEVASKSTEGYDRSGKFRMYQTLPSFKEYVIVNQYLPLVEVFFKIKENKWEVTSYVGLEATVKFATLDIALKMADIYNSVKDLQDPQGMLNFADEEE